MNVLQSLDAPVRFLVTLNHRRAIDERKVLRSVQLRPPGLLAAGVAAQARHRELNGAQRTYFCGAYWRCGFHEDGVVSAQSALAHFEEDRRPCRAASTPAGLGTGATRRAPHAFRYRLFLLYLDLAELPQALDGRWLWSARRTGARPLAPRGPSRRPGPSHSTPRSATWSRAARAAARRDRSACSPRRASSATASTR